MTLFPKSQGIPPQKASDVPSPGRYNPLLQDRSQDPCRKDPLEIYKAPRNKESEPGPDTLGLYTHDQEHHDNIHESRPRSRALSTLATPSKHHKELLRLETKLSERESDIAHLSETLQKSEQTTKKMRNALDKLEQDNESLRSEVSQLKKQLHGVAGLHAKAIETETEHDKSKKRRENETKQAEVALRGEMGHTQLEEVKREDEQLRKITDLIVGQSNLNAAEAAKVEKPTTELLSQRNPTQTVKILDLMQREIKEERENNAKLENQLQTANSAIKSPKDELFVPHPTTAPATMQASTIPNGMGISHVPQAPLSEVMENFDVQPDPREVGSTKIEKEEAAIRLTRSGGVQCLATAHPTATGRDFDKLGSGPEFGDRQFNDCVRTEPKGGRGSKRNQSRMGQTDEFQLLTSFVLPAKVLQSSKSDVKSLGLPTLDLHLARLLIGHHAIAQAIPESWCANEPPIAPEMIVQALDSTIQSHREQSSASHSLRVRLTIGPSQTVSLVTSPMPPIPQIKLLVSIDDHPTTYEGDPFLLTKTTYRSHYDHTRLRHGLWNHSSFLVIDYIEEKTTHERTLAE